MKYLVIKTTYFVDPHGTEDIGGVEKFITDDSSLLKMHGHTFQYGNVVGEDDLQGGEDGYNAEAESYLVKEVSDEEGDRLQAIITSYESIYVREEDTPIVDISKDPEYNDDIDEDDEDDLDEDDDFESTYDDIEEDEDLWEDEEMD